MSTRYYVGGLGLTSDAEQLRNLCIRKGIHAKELIDVVVPPRKGNQSMSETSRGFGFITVNSGIDVSCIKGDGVFIREAEVEFSKRSAKNLAEESITVDDLVEEICDPVSFDVHPCAHKTTFTDSFVNRDIGSLKYTDDEINNSSKSTPKSPPVIKGKGAWFIRRKLVDGKALPVDKEYVPTVASPVTVDEIPVVESNDQIVEPKQTVSVNLEEEVREVPHDPSVSGTKRKLVGDVPVNPYAWNNMPASPTTFSTTELAPSSFLFGDDAAPVEVRASSTHVEPLPEPNADSQATMSVDLKANAKVVAKLESVDHSPKSTVAVSFEDTDSSAFSLFGKQDSAVSEVSENFFDLFSGFKNNYVDQSTKSLFTLVGSETEDISTNIADSTSQHVPLVQVRETLPDVPDEVPVTGCWSWRDPPQEFNGIFSHLSDYTNFDIDIRPLLSKSSHSRYHDKSNWKH